LSPRVSKKARTYPRSRGDTERGLLTVWRRQVSRAAGVQVPGLVPVRIDPAGLPTAAHANPTEMTSSSGQCRGRIEIEFCEVRIRVEPGVDAATLSTVLSAVRGGR
jgi:transposase